LVAWSVDAVWDIECARWDQFLCGAIWTRDEGIRTFREPDGLADALLSLPAGSQAWAHAGGKYDVLWLIDHLAKNERVPQATVSMSGSSATSVKIKGGPWLRDSARLVPMSLARAAKIAGPNREKGDPGVAFEDLPLKWVDNPIMRRVLEYCVSDVELLRDVLLAIAGYAQSQGIELRGTIGGTAWATASKWCELEDATWDAETYGLVAPMYYGGLCAVNRTNERRIWRYDRKSAYPASLMEPLPMGNPLTCTEASAARLFARGCHGAYDATVRMPESLCPSLPIRHRNRLAYPFGTVRGIWAGLELEHALECGATIEKMHGAVAWTKEEKRLAPYAKKCFKLRDRLPDEQKKALGVWLKFLANSLTGKLGQSPESKVVALGDYADNPAYSLVGTSPWVWSRSDWRIPSCAMVHWAGTLTARARVELHRQILHVGDAWVYSDTDSVFSTRQQTRNVGDDLGEFDYEWAAKSKKPKVPSEPNGADWKCLAPKVYTYTDLSMDEAIAHAKGVPGTRDGDAIAIDVWNRYVSGEVIESDRGVKSLMTAAKGERLFERRKLSRSLHISNEWCGARLRNGNVTRAPNVNDLARLK
jgi:DNA polymerase type B, organellar and viral